MVSPGDHVVFDHAKEVPRRGGKITRSDVELPQVGAPLHRGGKLTTYLNLSRQTVDVVFEKLDRKAPKADLASPSAWWRDLGFRGVRGGLQVREHHAEVLSDRLLKLYGVGAAEVLKIGEDDPGLLRPSPLP